jgi:hypothetical protein
MNLTPAQRRKAREFLAKHKAVGVESIPDSSIDLAFAAGTIKMSDIDGVNSYSSSLDSGSSSSTYGGSSSSSYDSGSSSSSDSGSSGGGSCD